MKALAIFTLVICCIGVESGQEVHYRDDYVETEVTAEDGTAFATSENSYKYKADKAFKINGADQEKYWCTRHNPAKPVYLWFQFKRAKRVTRIKFEEKYELPPGEVYEVFASDDVEDYNKETILFNGTADVFSTGIAFENEHPYSCYGLKVRSQSTNGYVAVKGLMFGINFEGSCDSTWTARNHQTRRNTDGGPKNCQTYADNNYCADGTYGSSWQTGWGTFEDYADSEGRTAFVCPECGCKVRTVNITKEAVKTTDKTEQVPVTLDGAEYFATSVFKSVGYDYGPQRAFKRQTSGTKPWVSSSQEAFPQTVYVRLPGFVTVSGFSFRPRRFYRYSSPTKFDFIGSNDCKSWTVIVQVSGVQWNEEEEKKSWDIPIKQRPLFRCYGIKVHSTQFGKKVAIQDAKLWKGKGITAKFHELTAANGTANATSTFTRYGDYKADKAFKIQGATDLTYWSSKHINVQTPVYLWFQFKEPKCVTKMKFEEQYTLNAGEVYEVFGSNALEHCENPSEQTILTTGTADVFFGGKEFENQLNFYCYGLKMQNPEWRYTGVKRLQFAFKEYINKCLQNTHNCDTQATCEYIGQGKFDCFCNAGLFGDGTAGNCKECKNGETKSKNCNTCTCLNELWACTEMSCQGSAYTRIAGRFVKFYANEINWFDARASCQAEGADLITIYSEETIDWLTNQKQENVWTGATDQDNEGRWTWASGDEITVDFWEVGEPNNVGIAGRLAHCGVVHYGTMWDRDCYNANSYACERPSITELFTATNAYVRVTPANGTAFASSEYDGGYSAAKAFETSGYWCSEDNPDKPVCLWFEFNEPKRVSKIKFEERYELASGNDTYQVFASEAVGDCGNIANQEVLAEAKHGVFKTGIEFDNQRFFRCYGIRTYHQGARTWVGLRKVMFEVSECQNGKTKSKDCNTCTCFNGFWACTTSLPRWTCQGYSSWSLWTGCSSCSRSSRARRSRKLYCPNNSCPGPQSQTETKACSTSVRSSCKGTCWKEEVDPCASTYMRLGQIFCRTGYRDVSYACTKTTWGDTHFETLDNKFYEFDGECAYNYLTDKKRSFNLIIYTVPCGQLTNRTGTCLDQIDVSYKNTSISLKKDLKLEISNKYLDLPFENEDLDIHEASAEFVQVHFSNEISFLWNGDEIALDVPESLIGQYPDYKIFGLVGPYNNNSNDDFTSPDGKLLGSPKAFGESWKVPGSCVDHTELKKKIALKAMQKMKKYQKQNKDAAMVAEQQCNIMKTGIFKLCHDKMDPNQFKNLHNACVWDVSSCVGDISECLCPTLEVLSEECHQSGFAVGNWRKTISQCEKICQNGDVFQQCASPCNRTCQHMQSANICLETCVEGCACPKGMTRDVPGKHGKCIPHENCGCKFENHSYTKGQSISRDGKKITCDGTFWLKEKGAE